MCVPVCAGVYVHVSMSLCRMYMCISLCIFLCVYRCICTYVYSYAYTRLGMYTCICVFDCMHLCCVIYVCVCVCVCVCVVTAEVARQPSSCTLIYHTGSLENISSSTFQMDPESIYFFFHIYLLVYLGCAESVMPRLRSTQAQQLQHVDCSCGSPA